MKKALLYLFAFICIQYFVSWAVFAVWLLAAGHSSSDVLAVLNGQKLELITAPMQILSCAVYSALTLALFVWRKWPCSRLPICVQASGAYSSGAA